jgi:hypothetical protein
MCRYHHVNSVEIALLEFVVDRSIADGAMTREAKQID